MAVSYRKITAITLVMAFFIDNIEVKKKEVFDGKIYIFVVDYSFWFIIG